MIKRIPAEKKKHYNEVIKPLKVKIDDINRKIKTLERDIMAKRDGFENYRRIAIANEYLNLVPIYCEMNDYSVQILGIKNDAHLTAGRKSIYQATAQMEKIYGTEIDTPLTENDEIHAKLKAFNPRRKLNFFKKMEYDIYFVEHEFGESSKWKWSFVELYGRYAALLKNTIDFKSVMMSLDPRVEFYSERMELLRLVKHALDDAARRYREKYELGDHDFADMRKAIDFKKALMRIHIILKENELAQEVKKMITKWNQKLEEDIKAKEEKEKKKAKKKKKK